MIKLKIKRYDSNLEIDQKISGFNKPIVFFKHHIDDKSRFFLLLVIVDFLSNKIIYLESYTPDNVALIASISDGKQYKMNYAPHCTIQIRKGIDFLLFFQEENYFMRVNYCKGIIDVLKMEDIVGHEYEFKTISSTFYKDDEDNNFFYLTALDINNILHVYRMSNDLCDIKHICKFSGKKNPPHTVRKFKDVLLMSHEFTEAKYLLNKHKKVITDREMGALLTKLQMSIDQKNPDMNQYEKKRQLNKILDNKYDVECIKSKIILLDLETNERINYETSGSNSAHFEIDNKTNMVYISSHNFFEGDGYIHMFQPAVFDKYEYINKRLEWRGNFQYDKGFRYTSHRIFYVDDKSYMCTFGKPNRLMFIDIDTMKLIFYTDIGEDELTKLSNNDETCMYLNARHIDKSASEEFIGLEVSQDGEYIFFMDNLSLYFYNFREKKVYQKISYTSQDILECNMYRIISPHISYLT